MEKPTCLLLEAKRLNKELDELLWNGAAPEEIGLHTGKVAEWNRLEVV